MKTPEDSSVVEMRKRRVQVSVGESRTRASFKNECDVNRIMARAMKTGELPVRRGGSFSDVSAVGDFREVQEKVRRGVEFFEGLPRAVRRHFDDDVRAFLAWSVEPANGAELAALAGEPGKVGVDGKEVSGGGSVVAGVPPGDPGIGTVAVDPRPGVAIVPGKP